MYTKDKRKAHALKLRISSSCLLLFVSFMLAAQNINVPNKPGPMGTEVNTLTGNLYIPRNEIFVQARGLDLNLSFFYNSFNYNIQKGFGNGWNCSYGIAYRNDSATGKTITWDDSREDAYTLVAGAWKAPAGIFDSLYEYQPNKFILRQTDGTRFYFDNNVHKKLTRIDETNGNSISLNYSDSLLTGITHSDGQSLTLNYDGNGRLISVTDAITIPVRTYTYQYDANGNLAVIADPLGHTMRYKYLVNGPLSSITDKNSNVIDIIYYPDFTVSELIGCNKRLSLSYDTVTNITTCTDYLLSGNNQVTTYEYKSVNGKKMLSRKSGNCCGYTMSYEFDNDGNIKSSTDANGNVYSFTYDRKGNTLSVTDPLGQVNAYTYTTDFFNVKTYTDAKGNVYTMNYDAKGNLLQFIEPGNLTSALSYSPKGDILSFTDPKGSTTLFAYDAYGNITDVNAPHGYHMVFTNNARGNVLTSTDPRGFLYTAQYDILDRLISLTDPLNHAMQMTYDAEDNLVAVKNQNDQLTSLAYDASNRLVKITNALGKQTEMTYDAMDNLVKIKDALGNSANLVYDNLNRLSVFKDPLGNNSHFNYDGNGNLLSAAYADGRTIYNSYDRLNRQISSHDGTGSLGAMTYDANGNVTSVTNATGVTTSMTYDALDRLVHFTDPLGNTGSFAYDNNSNLVSATDRENHTVHYQYDSLNRGRLHTDENGFTTSMTFDAAGNVTAVTDQNNHITQYAYDDLNRLLTTTYPDSKYLQFTYDNIGNLLSRRLTDGSTIAFQYDSLNRLISKTLPGNNVFSYTYDALNRLVAASNSNSTVTMAYDALSRLTAETLNGRTTRYGYDVAARIQTTLYPDSTRITKAYDTRGRLTNISKNNSNIAAYQYNNANQVIAKNFGNGMNTSIQYDFANRVSNINTGNGAIQHTAYTFDKELNKNTIVRNNIPAASEEFSYDNGYRMTGYKRGVIGGTPVSQHSYQYDNLGNRTAVNVDGSNTTYTANNLNQLTGSNNGAQTINFTYDDNGNLTYDGHFYKTYDAEGRLLSDSASPSSKITYKYDVFGRRIQKTVNGTGVNYVYDGLSQIEQRDAATDTLLNRMVYATFLSPVLAERNGQTYYYHQNELNSVEAITSSNGALVERYQYDPYGKPSIFDAGNTSLPASPSGNRFSFTGQEYDKETANYHFHFRSYSPETGTFNQRDPIGYADGMGVYQYGGNDPVNGVDDFGLKWGDDANQDKLNVASNGGWTLETVYDVLRTRNALKIEKLNSMSEAEMISISLSEGSNSQKARKMFRENIRQNSGQIAKLKKAQWKFGFLKVMSKINPFINTADLTYKYHKATRTELDDCGNVKHRSTMDQFRLNLDVVLAIASYHPLMGAFNMVDWLTELSTEKSLVTHYGDFLESDLTRMSIDPAYEREMRGNLFGATGRIAGMVYLEFEQQFGSIHLPSFPVGQSQMSQQSAGHWSGPYSGYMRPRY